MRPLSLASRFLVTLVVTAALPLVLYGVFSLRGMREQIDEQVVRVFLPQLATDFAQKIETRLERTDQACAIVRELSRRVLDAPAEYPEYGEDYYAVFFADPDGMKLELVHYPWGYWKRVLREGADG